MREQVEQRIRELAAEYEAGQKMLAELEAKQTNLQQTLLRISGALQALQELLAAADVSATSDVAPAEATIPTGDALVDVDA